MTVHSNTHPLDDLAVYALDALEPGERAAVDAHLAGCVACRVELDRHLATLSRMTPPEPPPAHLWDRIASQLPAPISEIPATPSPPAVQPDFDQAPAEVLPFAHRPRHAGPPRRSGAPRAPWLAAVAAAAAVVVGVAVVSLRGSGGTDDVGDLAEAAAGADDSTIVRLTSAEGEPQARVVVTAEGDGYVLLDELPTLQAGRRYQLWKMNDTVAPVSLGVIGDGSADVAAVALPSDSTSFAITEEPEEGVAAPTGPVVADGEA
ncbi:MAG: anti-sigma factor domain-containing protein [Acidimicrobiales bacterium]